MHATHAGKKGTVAAGVVVATALMQAVKKKDTVFRDDACLFKECDRGPYSVATQLTYWPVG